MPSHCDECSRPLEPYNAPSPLPEGHARYACSGLCRACHARKLKAKRKQRAAEPLPVVPTPAHLEAWLADRASRIAERAAREARLAALREGRAA